MTDLKISSFFSTKVQDFLNKYDADGSGVIEKDNGELANMISGLKQGEFANVDSVAFTTPVNRAKAPKAPGNVDWEKAVTDFNNLSLSGRLKIANTAKNYAQDKFNDMVFANENAIIESLYNYPIVDLNMYKKQLGGSLESSINQQIKAVYECYYNNYEKVRTTVQNSIKQYDARYATDMRLAGVTYFNTEDTRIITGYETIDLHVDCPSPEELANMSEAQRDSKLQVFASEVELAYTEQIMKLFMAASNVEDAISTNYDKTSKSIDEVTKNGDLTHKTDWVHDLTGPHMGDIFNIDDSDPLTYDTFLSEVAKNSNSTGIRETETDSKPKKDGKYVENGKVVIRKSGQRYGVQGARVK